MSAFLSPPPDLSSLDRDALRRSISEQEVTIEMYKERLQQLEEREPPIFIAGGGPPQKRKAAVQSYVDTTKGWGACGSVSFSDDFIMQMASAAVGQLGPITADLDHFRDQLSELVSARKLCTASTSWRKSRSSRAASRT
jgi:hypothetical protein